MAMVSQFIHVRGAREHNLKNVDVTIPRDRLVVFTGVSGSGKSSLAFDTIYAEGQRRYVESLSAYARQFLGQMEKPRVDFIGGLSPAISIEQKTTSRNPRSTVGTVTEIYDYMRVLWARVGQQHCHLCGQPVGQQSAEQMVDRLLALPEGTRLVLLAPRARNRKGEYRDLFEEARKDGFVRVRVDGEIHDVEDLLPAEGKTRARVRLDRRLAHTIEIVVDRVSLRSGIESRLTDSVETTLRVGDGTLVAAIVEGEELMMSVRNTCVQCGVSFEDLSPQNFSFNHPRGMCPDCSGLGRQLVFDPDLIVRDGTLSLREGCIGPLRSVFGEHSRHARRISKQVTALAAQLRFSLDAPWQRLSARARQALMHGPAGDQRAPFGGVIPLLQEWFDNTSSENYRSWLLEQYMQRVPCPTCSGSRLCAQSNAVRIGGLSIGEACAYSVAQAFAFFDALLGRTRGEIHEDFGVRISALGYDLAGHVAIDLPVALQATQLEIGADVLREISGRLRFLLDVGLYYLTLDRAAPSLSGGEAQRIRLASQIGCGLMGVLYILDEPSIGLHQRDNEKLIRTLLNLRDMGNTVIVVEHDEAIMRQCDHIVDFGPGAGIAGGEIVASGTPDEVLANPASLTGAFLRGERSIPVPDQRRPVGQGWITVRGAAENNLRKIDVRFPLGVLTCVTGVSGSGKSSLVNEILYKALAMQLHGAHKAPGRHRRLEGLELIDKVIDIDQKPIGRTPRSNPATYVKVFDPIRLLFAGLPEARLRGYKPGRFSFNVSGGRCEACQGDGCKRIEMHFLADVFVTCDVCQGRRFNRETLQVKFHGHSIADVLDLTVREALEVFVNVPRIRRILETLADVGLDYVHLGQPATTLSGGEAQRVKLAKELCRTDTGHTVYLLDEPTTGLHFADVEKLLAVLNRLVERGNTVIIIEHNLDIIKSADYLIDMGPEGGQDGGLVIAHGTPEQVAAVETSYTGGCLVQLLAARQKLAKHRAGNSKARRAKGQASG
jgi:excinuclease ABC subunit A